MKNVFNVPLFILSVLFFNNIYLMNNDSQNKFKHLPTTGLWACKYCPQHFDQQQNMKDHKCSQPILNINITDNQNNRSIA